MGKTLIADSNLQESIVKLIEKKGIVYGLIVGKCTAQKDAAILLIPTPSELGEEGGTDQELSADAMSEQWIAEHARQVSCMLPGGISVIGVFVACLPSDAAQASTKARQALFAIHKLLRKRHLLSADPDQDTLEWSMLQICKSTKKTTCRTFNVLDHKCTARPADLKYQTGAHQWSTIQSSLRLDIRVHLPSSVADCSQYSKQLMARLAPVSQMIQGAVALVDGQLRIGSDPLEKQPSKKKSGKKGGGGSTNEGGQHSVELLTDRNDISLKAGSIERNPVRAQIHIRGTLSSRAFVDTKATVNEAVQAIKEDLLRSIHARFDLLACDLRQSSGDEEIKETDIAPPAVIATPRRIYARLPNSPIVVSDYAFAEEQPAEVAERLAELLDVVVTQGDLNLDAELMPDETLLQPNLGPSAAAEGVEVDGIYENAKSSRSLQYLGAAVVGVAGAVLAAAMSYLAIGQE